MMDKTKPNASWRVQVPPVKLALAYSSGGLTADDVRTLTNLIFALQGEWRCQIERDGCGELWAAIGARQARAGHPSIFLVCRVQGQLMLVDSSSHKRWRTVGIYDDVESLASDLGNVAGWHDGDTGSWRCGSLDPSDRSLALGPRCLQWFVRVACITT